MTVVALNSHSPDGSRRYAIGDEYEIDEAAAEILIAAGLVKTRSLKSEDSKSPDQYKRRDMRATN